MSLLTLIPEQFENIINDLIPNFNFKNWQKSTEWKIFNAGGNRAAEELQWDINNLQRKYQEELRQN